MSFRSLLVMILVFACAGAIPLIAQEEEKPSLLNRTMRVVTFGLVGDKEEESAPSSTEVAAKPAVSEQEEAPKEEKPSLLSRSVGVLTLGLVGGEEKEGTQSSNERKTKQSTRKALKSLAVEVKLRPEVVKLSEARRIHVRVRLVNGGKKMVSLKFPTTQRLEIRLIGRGGKVVEQWSESRAFSQVLGHVAINPGERVEYHETISTRELMAGTKYELEVSIPGYPDLTVVRRVVPER